MRCYKPIDYMSSLQSGWSHKKMCLNKPYLPQLTSRILYFHAHFLNSILTIQLTPHRNSVIISAMACPTLVSPEHGYLLPSSCSNGMEPPSRHCIVACDAGYQLEGRAVLTCLPLLIWNRPMPSCVKREYRSISRFLVELELEKRSSVWWQALAGCLWPKSGAIIQRQDYHPSARSPVTKYYKWISYGSEAEKKGSKS